MQLHELKVPKNSKKRKRIVGRGRGSGAGQTSGRGENGQKSRSGRSLVLSSEGGQMPLIRRLPKVGFNNPHPVFNQVVKLDSLNRFDDNTVVDRKILKASGLINSINKPFKILDSGTISKSLTIKVKSISKTAVEKIRKAGGKVEIIPRRAPMNKKLTKEKISEKNISKDNK